MAGVEVVFGAEAQTVEAAGHTVADLRGNLKHVLNIPPHAQARVNGDLVDGEYVTQDGDTLEFIVVEGHKEGEWAEELELARHITSGQLDHFRDTHPTPEDWRESPPGSGVYLYRERAVYKDFGPPTGDEMMKQHRRLDDIYYGVEDRDEAPGKMAYRDLERAHRLAIFSFMYAAARTPDRKLTDEEAYEILQSVDFSSDQTNFDELAYYDLPDYENWVRYVREARRLTDTNKYQRRSGRSKGGSIVSPDQI